MVDGVWKTVFHLLLLWKLETSKTKAHLCQARRLSRWLSRWLPDAVELTLTRTGGSCRTRNTMPS